MKQLADGVRMLSGFPPNAINVYVVDDMLVDAATRHARRRITRQIEGHEIRAHLLTHAHADHQGTSKHFSEKLGIPVLCHADDVDAAEGRAPLLPMSPLAERLTQRLYAGPPVKVDRVLQDGEMLGDWRVVHTPGHAAGQVMLFRESDRVAVVGDTMATINPLTGIPGLNTPPSIFSVDMDQVRASIKKLAALEPTLVCCGHGKPLRDEDKLQRFAAAL